MTLLHPSDAPDFEFEQGAKLKLNHDPGPEEVWIVNARVWNYDADVESYGPPGWYHKQYELGKASALGGDPRLVKEKDLLEHYEPASEEEAGRVARGETDA